MPSPHDLTRAALLMTAQDHAELRALGWQEEVITALHDRGFRPCRPDLHEVRFTGADPARRMGFLRQTAVPHLHISVDRDSPVYLVLEAIDTAIYEAGYKAGHTHLAAKFTAFTTACKSPTASLSEGNDKVQGTAD